MTQEEKAKAYDNIIQRVTELYETRTVLSMEQMEHLFPELRESENERIRKDIIKCVKEQIRQGNYLNINGNKALAYLEKQKEQNSDIELIQRSWYLEGYQDRKYGKEPMWIINTGEDGPKYELNPKYGKKLVKDVVKDVTKNKESATKFLKSAGIMDDNGELAEMYHSERKPVEWGEKEIEHLYTIAHYIKSSGYEDDGEFLEGVADKLKELRPSWKPSEKQMEAFEESLMSVAYTENKTILESLYNQLKKL